MKTIVAFILLIGSVAAQEYPAGVVPGSPEDLAARKPAFRSQITDLTRIGCKLRPDLGSGVNTEYGVITCSHCVRGATAQVECDGETAVGTVIARDVASDVALISVPWTRRHPTVPVAAGSPYGLMSLVARQPSGPIGIQKAMALHETLDGMWVTSEPTVAGQSGGGYIGANGDLVGIVSGNVVDIEPFRGLIIPASAIRRILPANAARQSAGVAEAAPTPYPEIERVLNLLPKPRRKFVEFGCGSDARWCVAAAEKWGTPCIGIEIDPTRARLAKERVRDQGLDHLIEIHQGDATQYDYSSADVAACYLYPQTISVLLPKIRHMRAFASYLHEPAGLGAVKNGDSWIYSPQTVASQPMVNYGGQLYAGRVCSDPRCGMCAAIQAGLAQSPSSPSRGQHYETRKVKVCNGKSCWFEDRQVLVND